MADSNPSGHRSLAHRLLAHLADVASFDVTPGSEVPPTALTAAQPDRHHQVIGVRVAVGTGLRALHDLPLPGDPGMTIGWAAVADRCRAAVAAAEPAAHRLPEPYGRYPMDQLLTMFIDGRPADPDADLVVCHGQPTLDRFLVEGGRFQGLTGFDSVIVANRHLDLAVIHQSVQAVLGPEAVFRLYAAYGQDPNVALLEHHILASHLLGTAPVSAEA